jgi:hypothetical protein
MGRLLAAVLVVGLSMANGAMAQQWKFIVGGEGPRILYTAPQRPNDSFPLYIYCDRRAGQIVTAVDTGMQRLRSGNASFSLAVAGEAPITVSGMAATLDYDGEYWMEVRLSWTHPIVALLARNQSMIYSSGTIRSFPMTNRGLSTAYRQFIAACT